MNIVAEILGYLGGFCIAFAFFSQMMKTIKNRDVKGLSLTAYIIYCIGILLWILYGIFLGSAQIVLFNLISLLFSVIILYLIILDKKN